MNDEIINQTNTPIKDNSINLDNQKKLNNNSLFNNVVSPISNKTQQATSLAFSQIMSSDSKNQSFLFDKDKLFESFLLFQKFMNMNQQISTILNKSNIQTPNNKDTIEAQEKIKQIDFEHYNTEGSQKENKEGTNNVHNYDEIPIKPTHSDFMELVEKTLANDNSAVKEIETNKPVKKIVKPTYYKKEIKISKPSKNEKKYSYYTDVLDENGQFNEKKVLKTLQKNTIEQKSNNQQVQIKESVANNKEDVIKTEEKQEEQKTETLPENNSLMIKEQRIDEQIKQLNIEIVKFKEERAKVFELKNEYEKLHQHFIDELEQFNIQKRDFEIEREIEEKKYEKEKKNLLQEMKGYNSIKIQNQNMILTAKRDKEQIEKLKNEINKIQKESKKKEITNKLMIDKLKKQIEEIKREPIIEQKEVKKIKGRSTSQYQSISKSKTSLQFSQKNLSTKQVNNIKQYNKSRTSLNPFPNKQKSKAKYNSSRRNQLKETIKEVPMIQKKQVKKDYHVEMIKDLITKSKLKNDNYDFIIPEQYYNTEYTLIKSAQTTEGKQIKLFTNNKREVLFPSGVKKEIFNDGYQIISFKNGDLKQIFPDQKSIYYYNDAKTVQTTYPDGLQVFKFSNGQIEKHFIDGSKQITFPDGSLRYILNDGYEETYFVDGTIQTIDLENVITMKYQDGHREIKYPDGKEESIYSEGEVKETHQEESDEIIEDV